ncbi:MAG: RDD family protein [Verrucomicrobiaceae bacterium]|nr:MAG: RDD family protein [Verrucomicrobiaceae bacterium]
MNDLNPYATPETDPTPPFLADAEPLVLASRGQRFIGSLVDGMVGLVIMVPITMGFQQAGMINSWMDLGLMDEGHWLLLSAIHFLIYMAVQWHFLISTGQSIGKKLVRTRIVTMDGRKPAMTCLVARREGFSTAIGMIPVVGEYLILVDALFVFRQDRRCLHDLVAGTQVVKILPEVDDFRDPAWQG